jgi:methylthioribose-1-phosphate isomerase
VIRAAAEAGKHVAVFADETRPFMQGARLTAWELVRDRIPTTVITESMAGPLMQAGDIDLVVVGSDRIAANGDVANKIGTYTVAVMAHAHGIPVYVAAPTSTIDLATLDGASIPIEERDPREVSHFRSVRVTPEGAAIRNVAFDVTPHRYVAAIVTETGVCRAPYEESLKASVERAAASAVAPSVPRRGSA